ncbi:MAG: rhomboid family intramembrane serine protease [Thermotogota bacterium]|nr:rhomboid family intramembrane serine protease [Thermotogota bacterium]
MNYGSRNKLVFLFEQAPMTISILVLNAVMYLLTVILGSGNIWNGGSTGTLIQFGAQYGPLVASGEWYRLITANFLHGGLMHIFFNSYALFYFGIVVEKIYSSQKFIFIYLISGVVGNLLTQVFYTNVPSVGASGAIFGLVGLMFSAGISGNMRGRLSGFSGTALLPMILINLFLGFTVPGINNIAHIGGLGTGFLLGFLISPNPEFRIWQKKLWLTLKYLCIILIILSIVLNFINLTPSVDKVITFHNTYIRVLSDLSTSSDKARYAYYLNLLEPFDSKTRHLKDQIEKYIDTNGSMPTLSEISSDFKSWQKEVLEKYDLQLQSE